MVVHVFWIGFDRIFNGVVIDLIEFYFEVNYYFVAVVEVFQLIIICDGLTVVGSI
jgi:hypothetical protein